MERLSEKGLLSVLRVEGTKSEFVVELRTDFGDNEGGNEPETGVHVDPLEDETGHLGVRVDPGPKGTDEVQTPAPIDSNTDGTAIALSSNSLLTLSLDVKKKETEKETETDLNSWREKAKKQETLREKMEAMDREDSEKPPPAIAGKSVHFGKPKTEVSLMDSFHQLCADITQQEKETDADGAESGEIDTNTD